MSNANRIATRTPFYELVAPNMYLGQTIATALAGAYDGVVAFVDHLAKRRRIAETIAALDSLDDRVLRDIGIHRSQIGSVSRAAVEREALARNRR